MEATEKQQHHPALDGAVLRKIFFAYCVYSDLDNSELYLFAERHIGVCVLKM